MKQTMKSFKRVIALLLAITLALGVFAGGGSLAVMAESPDGLLSVHQEGQTAIAAAATTVAAGQAGEAEFVSILGERTRRVAPGASIQLEAWVLPDGHTSGNVAWASNDSSIASVSATGHVTGVAQGSTRIVASINGLTTSIPVTVEGVVGQSLESFRISGTTDRIMPVRGPLLLEVQTRPVNHGLGHAAWTSSNSAVAVIESTADGRALVRGVAEGTTVITATLGVHTHSIDVHVNAFDPDLAEQLQAAVEGVWANAHHARAGRMGQTVGVVMNGEVWFAQHGRLTDSLSFDVVTEHSIFGIASTTKPITGMIVGDLQARGYLNILDPISRFLPYDESEMVDPHGVGAITVVDLASHHSGFLIDQLTNYGPNHWWGIFSNHGWPTRATFESWTPGQRQHRLWPFRDDQWPQEAGLCALHREYYCWDVACHWPRDDYTNQDMEDWFRWAYVGMDVNQYFDPSWGFHFNRQDGLPGIVPARSLGSYANINSGLLTYIIHRAHIMAGYTDIYTYNDAFLSVFNNEARGVAIMPNSGNDFESLFQGRPRQELLASPHVARVPGSTEINVPATMQQSRMGRSGLLGPSVGGGGGEMMTTAYDMTRLMLANLGHLPIDNALREGLHTAMHAERPFPLPSTGLQWGLGFRDGEQVFGHTGAGGGFTANMEIVPGRDFGYFIATSEDSALNMQGLIDQAVIPLLWAHTVPGDPPPQDLPAFAIISHANEGTFNYNGTDYTRGRAFIFGEGLRNIAVPTADAAQIMVRYRMVEVTTATVGDGVHLVTRDAGGTQAGLFEMNVPNHMPFMGLVELENHIFHGGSIIDTTGIDNTQTIGGRIVEYDPGNFITIEVEGSPQRFELNGISRFNYIGSFMSLVRRRDAEFNPTHPYWTTEVGRVLGMDMTMSTYRSMRMATRAAQTDLFAVLTISDDDDVLMGTFIEFGSVPGQGTTGDWSTLARSRDHGGERQGVFRLYVATNAGAYFNLPWWSPEADGVTIGGAATRTIGIGEISILVATITPAHHSSGDVTWHSSNSNVATVEDGIVIGVSAGTATITARTVNGIEAYVEFIVDENTVVNPVFGLVANTNTGTYNGTHRKATAFVFGTGIVDIIVPNQYVNDLLVRYRMVELSNTRLDDAWLVTRDAGGPQAGLLEMDVTSHVQQWLGLAELEELIFDGGFELEGGNNGTITVGGKIVSYVLGVSITVEVDGTNETYLLNGNSEFFGWMVFMYRNRDDGFRNPALNPTAPHWVTELYVILGLDISQTVWDNMQRDTNLSGTELFAVLTVSDPALGNQQVLMATAIEYAEFMAAGWSSRARYLYSPQERQGFQHHRAATNVGAYFGLPWWERPATGITIPGNAARTMDVGDTLTLSATVTPALHSGVVVWASSDETVATVVDGVVTAVAEGIATITASINNHTANVTVTVNAGTRLHPVFGLVVNTNTGTYNDTHRKATAFVFGTGVVDIIVPNQYVNDLLVRYRMVELSNTRLDNAWLVERDAGGTQAGLLEMDVTSYTQQWLGLANLENLMFGGGFELTDGNANTVTIGGRITNYVPGVSITVEIDGTTETYLLHGNSEFFGWAVFMQWQRDDGLRNPALNPTPPHWVTELYVVLGLDITQTVWNSMQNVASLSGTDLFAVLTLSDPALGAQQVLMATFVEYGDYFESGWATRTRWYYSPPSIRGFFHARAATNVGAYFGLPWWERPATAVTIPGDASRTLDVGDTLTLTANVTPALHSGVVAWASSNDGVATVVNGVVTGVAPGTANITASINGHSAVVEVVVGSSSVLLGDINEDTNIDAADLMLLRQWNMGIRNFATFNQVAADVNEDNTINHLDLTMLTQYLAGVIPSLGGRPQVAPASFSEGIAPTSSLITPFNGGGLEAAIIVRPSTTAGNYIYVDIVIVNNPDGFNFGSLELVATATGAQTVVLCTTTPFTPNALALADIEFLPMPGANSIDVGMFYPIGPPLFDGYGNIMFEGIIGTVRFETGAGVEGVSFSLLSGMLPFADKDADPFDPTDILPIDLPPTTAETGPPSITGPNTHTVTAGVGDNWGGLTIASFPEAAAPTVNFTVNPFPGLITWDSTTGELEIDPTLLTLGPHTVTMTATNSLGTSLPHTVIITVNAAAPTFTLQPVSTSVVEGGNHTFSVVATDGHCPSFTLQWQTSTNNGLTWSNITGATGPTHTVSATLAMNGHQFRAVATNSHSTVNSNAVTLTVTQVPMGLSIITPPADQTANVGGSATFDVTTAWGTPPLSYQWQVLVPGGTWANVPSATGPSLTISNITAAMHGNQYRVTVTDDTGTSITSTAGTLTIPSAIVGPTIITQPTSITRIVGQTATFTVGAVSDTWLIVQWYVLVGGVWQPIAGATDFTLTLHNVTLAMNGNQYRVVISDLVGSPTVTSVTVTLTVNAPTVQPTPYPTQQPTPTPRPTAEPTPSPTPHPYVIPQYRTTVTIANALATAQAHDTDVIVVFGLEDRYVDVYIGVDISREDWAKILDHEGTLILQAPLFSAHISYQQLAEWDVDGANIITILLHQERDDSNSLDAANELLGHDAVGMILAQSPINNFLLGMLHNFEVLVDGEAIEAATPTTISVDISTLNLTPEQLIRLTGFVFDEETGTYILLPGAFTEDGETFTFQFDGSGIIGIMVYTLPGIFMRLTIGNLEYTLNGETLLSDVAPHISLNRTMVPVRIVTEALGGYARWDSVNRVAYLYFDDVTLRLPTGQELPQGLGMPVMLNSRVFVPLRYVSEMIGAEVFWDASNRAVYVFRR